MSTAARAAALAALLLAGCGGIRHETRPTVWVALEPESPAGGLLPGGPTLEVGRFVSAAPFDTDRVATREGGHRWTFAAYHRWVAEPGEMVSACLRNAFSASDLFGAVFTPPALCEPDYRVSGAVRTLHWDRDADTAVVELEASLVVAPERPCGFWVHRTAVPVPADTVDAYLEAASTAMARAAAALREDVAGALATCRPAPAP